MRYVFSTPTFLLVVLAVALPGCGGGQVRGLGAQLGLNFGGGFRVAAVARQAPSNELTANPSVTFEVEFSDDATGVDASDFAIDSSGVTGASVQSVTPVSASIYRVAVATGSNDGTLRLDVLNDGTIQTPQGRPLEAQFGAGDSYTLDRTPPSILGIVRKSGSPHPTSAPEVIYTVTFSETVSGVSVSDFTLASAGISGASIASVTAAGPASYEVRVLAGSGNGDLRLDLSDQDSISDGAGNVLSGPGAQNYASGESFSIDRTGPIITFTTQPAAISTSASESASFTATDADTSVASIECRLDSGVYGACTSPFAVSGLLEGSHAISVRATDAVGNATTQSVSWITDRTAPVLTLSGSPAATDADATPTFTFSATDALTSVTGYECRVDAGAYASCASPWTSSTLAHGAHTFDVRATDAAGNTSAAAHHSWSIDLNAPTVLSVVRKTGAENPTRAATVLYTVSFSESVSGVSAPDFSLTLSGVTGAAVSTVTPVSASEYEVAVSSGTGTGTIRLDVLDDDSIVDGVAHPLAGGNTTGESFTLDRTAPAISFTSVPAAAVGSTSTSVSFSATDALTSVASLECQTDAGSFGDCSSPLALSGLSEGSHTVTVRATDALGNAGSLATSAWIVDLTAPSISITSAPPALDIESRPTFVFSATDALTSIASYQCSLDSGAYAACVSPFVAPTLGNGPHTFDVRATDAAGNISAAAHHSWTIDNTPPDPFTISGIMGGTDAVADGVLSNGTAATVNWTDAVGEDSYDVTVFESDGTTVKCATVNVPAGTTQHAFSSCALTLGSNYLAEVIAKDALNNQTRATNAPFGFSVATGAPAKVTLAGPAAISSGNCTEFQVESRSSDGLPAIVPSDRAVNIAANNSAGAFYPDSSCSTSAVTSATILANQYQASVWFRSNTAPENATLVGTSSGLAPGTKSLTVGNPPSRLLISGSPQIATGRCVEYRVSLLDNLGNKVSTATSHVVNLAQNGSVLFYAGNTCASSSIASVTIQANEDTAVFYARGALVQSVDFEASDAGAVLAAGAFDANVVLNLDWWDPTWGSRVLVTLDNLDQAAALSDQPVLIQLDSSRINYARTQNAGQDLRFVTADQTTVLPHEIELWNESGTSYVWVKVPAIQASSNQNYVFMYYDNAATSDAQSIASTWASYWGVWHLGEDPTAAAPQYRDSTMAGDKHATAKNAPTRAQGAVGYGVDVSGNNDTIDTGFDLSTVLGRTSTFSLWLRTTQVGHNTNWLAPGITGIEVSGGVNDIFFGWIDALGRICVTAGNGVGARSGFVVNDDAWRHITITRDHASGAVRFYVNGVLNGSGTSTTGAITTAFREFGIIGDTGGTPEDYNGVMDEIRVFNTIQTTDKIRADYKFQTSTYVGYGLPETP